MRSLPSLVVFVVAAFAAAAAGARFSPGAWYETLAKPAWTPPNWLFGPVWTLLYLAMAVAAWLVWRRAGWPAAAAPLALWVLQLALNAAWSWLFFGLHRPDWALAEIVVLWLAIAATLLAFRPISPPAAWLLAPYLLWVTYAAALNAAIWRLWRG